MPQLQVNGEEVPETAIAAEFERLRPSYEQHAREHDESADLDRLRAWCRENLVEQTLLRQEAARRFPSPAADATGDATTPPDAMKQLLDSVTRDLDEPTQEQIEAFYERHKQQFGTPERVHASHIVKRAKPGESAATVMAALLNVQQQLKHGADIRELAAKHSDCPERGGDLGVFGCGQMVQEFEDVVFAMQPGEVSDVFQTQFGHHVVVLHERHPGAPAPLEEVAPRIRGWLQEERRRAAVEAFVDELKASADIQGL